MYVLATPKVETTVVFVDGGLEHGGWEKGAVEEEDARVVGEAVVVCAGLALVLIVLIVVVVLLMVLVTVEVS